MHVPTVITNILPFANTASTDVNKSSLCSIHPFAQQCIQPELQHLNSICIPEDTNATTALSFPCIEHSIISEQCYYGRPFAEVWNARSGTSISNDETAKWKPQSPSNQRLCVCESHFFDTLVGCGACYQAHGAGPGFYYPEHAVSSTSSSYCAATATPSVGMHGMLQSWDHDRPEATSVLSSIVAAAKTTTYSDPLAGSTAVYLYYTPTVTGSAVFDIGGATHGAKPTTTNVVDGQITASSDGATGALARTKFALAGILALTAFVALL